MQVPGGTTGKESRLFYSCRRGVVDKTLIGKIVEKVDDSLLNRRPRKLWRKDDVAPSS
jgi:hypothetical protein